MAVVSYLDASAIVKLAIREPESDAVETHMASREALISSRLGEAEVLRAVRRVGSEVAIERAQEALRAFFLRDVDVDILRRAGLLDPPELRPGDAIHLATALAIADPELEFVTYDNRLAKAAEAAGLRVVQPGRDPRAPGRAASKRKRARLDRSR